MNEAELTLYSLEVEEEEEEEEEAAVTPFMARGVFEFAYDGIWKLEGSFKDPTRWPELLDWAGGGGRGMIV